MKFLKWLALIVLILIILYFLGPKPSSPVYNTQLPTIPASTDSLENFIKKEESSHHVKPGNEAGIIWFNDSLQQKTEYAVVYLHGFSASHQEGNPAHIAFAKKFGCNLFLSRLAEHGIDTTEPLVSLTAEKLWNSAKEAYAIGKQLGKKVILMGTSTGGTLALKLAAEYPEIAGLILLSPNIEINNHAAWVLNNHWGLQVAHLVEGEYHIASDTSTVYKQYWNHKYKMEAAVQLQELLETTMKAAVFEKVKQPALVLYYYKDEEHQDDVVKVSAIKRMFFQLGTDNSLKRKIAIPTAGNHVMGSSLKSKDVMAVERACDSFAIEELGLKEAIHP